MDFVGVISENMKLPYGEYRTVASIKEHGPDSPVSYRVSET